MIDKLGLARGRRGLSQGGIVAKSIYKRGLAYVRAAYKGKLRQFLLGLLRNSRAAAYEFCLGNFHTGMFWL